MLVWLNCLIQITRVSSTVACWLIQQIGFNHFINYTPIQHSLTMSSTEYWIRIIARHFLPVDTLYEVLDGMAMNKFNVMHWHIVDDQRKYFMSHRLWFIAYKYSIDKMKGMSQDNICSTQCDIQYHCSINLFNNLIDILIRFKITNLSLFIKHIFKE